VSSGTSERRWRRRHDRPWQARRTTLPLQSRHALPLRESPGAGTSRAPAPRRPPHYGRNRGRCPSSPSPTYIPTTCHPTGLATRTDTIGRWHRHRGRAAARRSRDGASRRFERIAPPRLPEREADRRAASSARAGPRRCMAASKRSGKRRRSTAPASRNGQSVDREKRPMSAGRKTTPSPRDRKCLETCAL
jgi:hypothetical protein